MLPAKLMGGLVGYYFAIEYLRTYGLALTNAHVDVGETLAGVRARGNDVLNEFRKLGVDIANVMGDTGNVPLP